MEDILVLNSWHVRFDAQLNRRLYKQIATAAPEDCGCTGCIRFTEFRDSFYPAEFRELLVTLGIDYCKEAEVTTYIEPGKPPMSGWYNFVGEIELGENELHYIRKDFRIQISSERALVQRVFDSYPILMLEWQWLPEESLT